MALAQAADPGYDGRIGPNAVTRLAEALDESLGEWRTNELFRAAGQLQYRHAPPAGMVDERVVTALHAQLRKELDAAARRRVTRRAGTLTADYLLARRIPLPARALLHSLPAPWAAPILVRAMAAHAWTFAGSGAFSARRTLQEPGWVPGHGSERARWHLMIRGCPLCRGAATPQPVCDYFSATFERLFASLVRSSARVREIACRATGAEACTFEVRW